MERRTLSRIPTNIDARFFYGNMFYTGTVLDMSEKGLFLNTKRYLPNDAMFVLIFHLEGTLLKVIAKVKRRETSDAKNGMGVELLSPSINYLEFVDSLKDN